MPVSMLGPSPALAIEHFTSFDEFRPSEVMGGGISVPLHPEDFSVSRAILALSGGLLVLQRSFARRLEADMGTRGTGLIIPLASPAYAEINGKVINNSNIALLRNKVPAHTIEPHANTYVMLRFNSGMQDRGWADFDDGLELFNSEPEHLDHLRTAVLDSVRFASACTKPREFSSQSEGVQETLIAALDNILVLGGVRRARAGSFDKHRKIVAKLDELVQTSPADPLFSDGLAKSLGTSVRTLQTAVQAVHGMSLHQHLRLKKLWWVRSELLTGNPLLTVRAAALANGFWHMGEFSQLYKATFGDTPSETLLRARRFCGS
jgi:AraC family ethanolamine operon transcriptional activator